MENQLILKSLGVKSMPAKLQTN